MSAKRLLFVGGGTVGHVAPVLAVMAAVQEMAERKEMKVQCSYVGLPADLDSPVIKESKLEFDKYVVRSGKLHRHATWDQAKQLVALAKGMGDAKKLLKKIKPDLVFATGGYSTVPVVRTAARLNIPIYCHESDVVLGLANRLAVKNAKLIFTTFPIEAYPQLRNKRVVEVGKPVREMFYTRAKGLPKVSGQILDPKVPVLTVIGGSQGGRRMNHLVADSWTQLLPHFQIVQLTGQLDHATFVEKKTKLPKALQGRLFVESFLTEELPALFQRSTVVITRAGGTSAELAASRACVILVPLSTAAQNHQMANARVLEKAGAAVVLDELVTTPAELVAIVKRLASDTHEQTSLRVAIGEFDHPDAAKRMAEYLLGQTS